MKFAKSRRYATTVFADDLRYEIDDKVSLMGIYPDSLSIREGAPASLPPLVLYICYFELDSEEAREIKVLIYLPGVSVDSERPSNFLTIDLQDLDASLPKVEVVKPSEYRGFALPITLDAAPIETSGFLRVCIQCRDEIIHAGALYVQLGD